jgi:uncharacterized protein with von Willebrand factor type A (vWA) domain
MSRRAKTSSLSRLVKHGSRWVSRLPKSYREAIAQASLVDNVGATASGLLTWRDALLDGKTPTAGRWPAGALGRELVAWCERSGLLPHCRDNPELVDLVVLAMLQLILQAQRQGLQRIERLMRTWLQKERSRRTRQAMLSGQETTEIDPFFDEIEAHRQQLAGTVETENAQWLRDNLDQAWQERIRAWNSVEEVFGELGRKLQLGWDLTRGVLHQTGWEQVMKIHELIKRLPQVAEVARTIGRLREADNAVVTETRAIVKAVSRVVEELQLVRQPDFREETEGVHRSADLPRMLPAETMLLRHPAGRKLWQARLAEHSLATYQVSGYGLETVRRTETEYVESTETFQRKLDRGPVIVCLDTSGSMSGVPEIVAKAITFELMRLAAAEQRKCYLFTFSGPRDLAGRELTLDQHGLQRIIDLLSMSFHGGTDISSPMRDAVGKLSQAGWERADVILVSDGEFSVPEDILHLVSTAKRHKALRVHGLIIAQRGYGEQAMGQLCDPLHYFSDWQNVRGF